MKVAAVQISPTFADVAANVSRVAELLRSLASQGVQFAVFPEAMLTGYCFDSKEEALKVALPRDADGIDSLARVCDEAGISAVVGFAERDAERLFNTAAVFVPNEQPQFYRKTHLPYLGMDRFADVGDALDVFDIPGARIGILICFDVRIPEAARTLALKGADILCVPTNWPEQAIITSNCVCPARASENQTFVIAADRVGEENGVRFLGYSKIIAPGGTVLAAADHHNEEILVAEIDVSLARVKNPVIRAGEYELPLFAMRRPELYAPLLDSAGLGTPK